ncbi:MAG: UMP kinase [bacterium]
MENISWTVISLGGSLICPDRVDGDYVSAISTLIRTRAQKGERFAIITGGGKLCREYQDALRKAHTPSNDELDWLGIYTTRYNAELLRLAIGDVVEPAIYLDPRELSLTGRSVLVGGGYEPGHSSDGAAVTLAKSLGAKKVINLSNIDYVYTADPRKDATATPIKTSSWDDFRKLLPETWDPGFNAPFDPIAAKMAQELGLEVAVMNGKNLENLSAYLDGKEFVGTVIR